MTVRLREQSRASKEELPPPDPAALLEKAIGLAAHMHKIATRVTELGNQHRRFAGELLLFSEQLHDFATDVQELADYHEIAPEAADTVKAGEASHDDS